jgi:inner membrane protease ATP23
MASSSSMHAQDPSFLDSFNTWRRSLAQLTGLGLTPEEKAQHDQTVDTDKAAKQCKACESYRDELIQTSEILAGPCVSSSF